MSYNYTFLDTVPAGLTPILISGEESLNMTRKKFLLIEDTAFEIRYAYHCSPFCEAHLTGNVLAVGFEGFFYLYNISEKVSLLALEMEGYFGNLHLHNEQFFVADACGIYCINREGKIIWQNKNLGIDGVIIHTFGDTITGQGEFDPPGGWVDFRLDVNSGTKL